MEMDSETRPLERLVMMGTLKEEMAAPRTARLLTPVGVALRTQKDFLSARNLCPTAETESGSLKRRKSAILRLKALRKDAPEAARSETAGVPLRTMRASKSSSESQTSEATGSTSLSLERSAMMAIRKEEMDPLQGARSTISGPVRRTMTAFLTATRSLTNVVTVSETLRLRSATTETRRLETAATKPARSRRTGLVRRMLKGFPLALRFLTIAETEF